MAGAAPVRTVIDMKTLWKTRKPLDPDREYRVLASDLPPRSIRSTGRLFRGAMQVQRQLATTEGVMGFATLARPLRKQYATLSVWVDEAALARFARAGRHGELMDELRQELAETTFVRWTITGAEGRPSWSEVLRRLADARAAATAAAGQRDAASGGGAM